MIAVEPVGKDISPCLKSGNRLWPNPPQFLNTIAEGIMTQQAGQLTFPILCDLVMTLAYLLYLVAVRVCFHSFVYIT